MKPEIVQTQSWRYKTIVVIKRQHQTTISNKQTKLVWACLLHVSLPFVRVLLDVVFQLIKAELKQWLIGQCSLWGYDSTCFPENGSYPYAEKMSVYWVGICSSSLYCNYRWPSARRKKAVDKARQIPLWGNATKCTCVHTSGDLLKQLLHKLQNPQSFRIHLDEITDISDEVQLIVYCRVADEKKQFSSITCTVWKLLEFAQLLKTSRPNSIRLLRNVVWIGRSVSQLLPMEQQSCKVLLMELSEISKSFPLTVFQLIVWFTEKHLWLRDWWKKRISG